MGLVFVLGVVVVGGGGGGIVVVAAAAVVVVVVVVETEGEQEGWQNDFWAERCEEEKGNENENENGWVVGPMEKRWCRGRERERGWAHHSYNNKKRKGLPNRCHMFGK